MPIYEFKCEKCGHVDEFGLDSPCPKDPQCLMCAGSMKRVYSFTTTGMPTQAGRRMHRK